MRRVDVRGCRSPYWSLPTPRLGRRLWDRLEGQCQIRIWGRLMDQLRLPVQEDL